MRERLFFVVFLVAVGALVFQGRDLLVTSQVLTGVLTFGAVTTVSVLGILFYRVKLELQASRHELARKEAEINFAYEVQKALFPKSMPSQGGLEYHGIYLPARGIGGDFFDVLERPDGRHVFAIADISGKGISAAILMSNLQALLRREVLDDPAPYELCRRLNYLFYQVSPPASYATLFYGEWDPGRGRLSYVNAGHNPPLLFRNGDVQPLREGGFPIGIFSETEFDMGAVELESSDLLVLYSDGITEACTSGSDEFGSERLAQVVTQNNQRSSTELAGEILKAVSLWAGDERQDDQTLLLVRVAVRNGRGES